jgi:hypothetical protein
VVLSYPTPDCLASYAFVLDDQVTDGCSRAIVLRTSGAGSRSLQYRGRSFDDQIASGNLLAVQLHDHRTPPRRDPGAAPEPAADVA